MYQSALLRGACKWCRVWFHALLFLNLFSFRGKRYFSSSSLLALPTIHELWNSRCEDLSGFYISISNKESAGQILRSVTPVGVYPMIFQDITGKTEQLLWKPKRQEPLEKAASWRKTHRHLGTLAAVSPLQVLAVPHPASAWLKALHRGHLSYQIKGASSPEGRRGNTRRSDSVSAEGHVCAPYGAGRCTGGSFWQASRGISLKQRLAEEAGQVGSSGNDVVSFYPTVVPKEWTQNTEGQLMACSFGGLLGSVDLWVSSCVSSSVCFAN